MQNHPETSTPSQTRRWRRYLAEERHEADTYRALARSASADDREILTRLVEAEERHEEYWLNLLGEHAVPAPKAPWRTRLLSALAKKFGTVFTLAMMQRTEQRNAYDLDEDAPAEMAADEHIHGEVVRALAAKTRSKMAGLLRAGVFGINDGLLSNVALILGVGAAGARNEMVILAGLSGLLAGALSMGAGEYISVRSQRELLEASTADPNAMQHLPALDVEVNELALVYRARGMDAHQAEQKAQTQLTRLHETGSMTENEPQSNFDEVGSPLGAAFASFGLFSLGALLPVIPFLLGITGATALIIATTSVGIALLITGGLVGVLSGQPPLWRAIRQLLIGILVGASTYGLGALFGVQNV